MLDASPLVLRLTAQGAITPAEAKGHPTWNDPRGFRAVARHHPTHGLRGLLFTTIPVPRMQKTLAAGHDFGYITPMKFGMFLDTVDLACVR